jgi:hypothetical protein
MSFEELKEIGEIVVGRVVVGRLLGCRARLATSALGSVDVRRWLRPEQPVGKEGLQNQ